MKDPLQWADDLMWTLDLYAEGCLGCIVLTVLGLAAVGAVIMLCIWTWQLIQHLWG